MDSKAYYEMVMQDFNQFREDRSLRRYLIVFQGNA